MSGFLNRFWSASARRAGASLAGATVALLLTACSPAEKSSSAGGIEPSSSAAPVDGAAPSRFIAYPETDFRLSEPALRPPEGVAGGTLRASIAADTVSLDPHAVSATYMQWFGRFVFDNLVYLDAAGKATPWLAKSWEISPDGLSYTFHLRDDVTFSDGAKFNADAVLANLEHMRDPETRSPLAGRYIAPYDRGEVIDEFTFRAHLREPYAPFLDVLAQSWLAIVSPKAIRENPRGLAFAPVGSGPFILESYTRQQSLKLVRRTDYHWAPDYLRHHGPAYLDCIEVDIIPEAMVRSSALSSGQHELTLDLPPQSAGSLRNDPGILVSSRVRQGIPTRVLTFNVERAPFDDVRVRRALALAIDREGIARIIGFGEYLVKTDFLASSTRHYDPSFQHFLRYDFGAANRLLDEAGWITRDKEGYRTREGRRLGSDFLVNETATPSASIVALQSDFKKVGFELRITQLPAAQVTQRRRAGDFEAIGGGVWHTNTPDALYILHHSDEIVTPTRFGQNTGHFSDGVLDNLLSEARRSGDEAERQRLYSAAQARLVELVPAIPVYENHTLVAYTRRLRGVVFDTSHNTVVLTGAWLDHSK